MKRKFLPLFLIGAACLGCCAVPLWILLTGAVSVGVLFSPASLEMLVCAAPLALLVIYWGYRRYQQKHCCKTPGQTCTGTQCGVDSQSS